jgi:hypothetical protein
MRLANPYSAEHPVPPSKFAGRKPQIAEFCQYMRDTLDGNSKNIAILGEWGIGKTSILRKFRQLAEDEGFVCAIIELGPSIDSLTSLFEVITKTLADEAQRKKRLALSVKEFLESLSLSVSYGPVGVSFQRSAPPDILRFKRDLKEIRERIKSPFIIMLDNAEQLLRIEGSLMELRNIFQSIQSMDEVNCMLILAGKEQLFADIRAVYEPAVRFFWGIGLAAFAIDETREAIQKPLAEYKVRFTDALIERIHRLTQGHPYFVQLFAYHLFNLREGLTIDLQDLAKNYTRLFDFIGKRLFESTLSILSTREREIIQALAKVDKEIFTNTDAKTATKVKGINQYLKNMSELEVPVLVKLDRGQYKFYHPLFREYVKRVGS